MALAASLGMAAAPACALEALVLYDDFSAGLIDANKWPTQGVRLREVAGKKLHMLASDFGSTESDAGSAGANWSTTVPNPTTVTSIRATVTVKRFVAKGCAGNPAPADTRARVLLQTFNVATPTPGSSINDVIAQFRVIRKSNSKDAADTLRVEGLVAQCNDATCSVSTTLGNLADLGTVKVGQAVVLQLEWDRAKNRFLFRRDSGSKRSVVYAVSDTNTAGNPFALVGLRNTVPNCTGTPRPSALMEATFDNVSLNASAVP